MSCGQFNGAAGLPGKRADPAQPTQMEKAGSGARFDTPCGIGFLARTVALVADRGRNELRVVHLEKNDRRVFLVTGLPWLAQPFGVATLQRLDWCDDAELPENQRRGRKLKAVVVVSQFESSDLLFLDITQQKGLPCYSAVAKRVVITGTAVGETLPLRGVAALSVGRKAIDTLRRHRDEAIDAANTAFTTATTGNDGAMEQEVDEDSHDQARTTRDAAISEARQIFREASTTTTEVFVARCSGGQERGAIVRVDLRPILNPTGGELPRRRDRDNVELVRCEGQVIHTMPTDPFDVAVDVDRNVYVSGLKSPRVLKVAHTDGGWTATTFAGREDGLLVGPKDGEASQATFSGVAGICTYQPGRAAFCIDAKTRSVAKITCMDGYVAFARAWQGSFGSFSIADPTMAGNPAYEASRVKDWSVATENLESCCRRLEELDLERRDAIGLAPGTRGQGPELMMDSNSLAAHTRTTCGSMRAAYEDIKRLDPRVAAKMNPASATDREQELW